MDGEDNRLPNRIDASGTSVPTDVVDEFIFMRLAHLLEDGKLLETLDRTTAADYARGGNGGHEALIRNAKSIREALMPLEPRKPASEKTECESNVP